MALEDSEDHAGVRLPPEWEPHDWTWLGFPHDAAEWPGFLDAARREVAAFANALTNAGETVRLIVNDAANADIAAGLVDPAVRIEQRHLGDIWLRDTGPIVVLAGREREARLFRFNGWGGKYMMAGDEDIGARLAASAKLCATQADFVLEGGAIDVDGAGLAVTTEQCLLNPNRNPDLSREDIESLLARHLGVERLLWLGDGLAGDHTDGHVDNLARFVAPGRLAVPRADERDDPNAAAYADAAERARAFGIEVVDMVSPGRVEIAGELVPASYMNFYIANKAVLAPVYDLPSDRAALDRLAELFPGRETVGLPARALVRGGGALHCCTQQMPTA